MTTYKDINRALPSLLGQVLQADVVSSRNGKTRELAMQQITLTDPAVKECVVPGRKVSLPAQIAETMWVLAGRNDVAWLQHYLPRAAEFSDDGKVWRGGYGPRLRAWGPDNFDQLGHVVRLLHAEPDTRRAVFNIYNPDIDSATGKDIPCNNWVHFLPRDGFLNAHVAIRSNDLFWGWSGINAFEWTSLLQVVAGLTGLHRGSITFSISSLHLYEHHWARAESIVNSSTGINQGFQRPSPEFVSPGNLQQFDALVEKWFQIEGQIRKGGLSPTLLHQVSTFPEPMLRSWLTVLLAWHHDDIQFLKAYRGTALYQATELSPKRKDPAKAVGIAKGTAPGRKEFTEFATQLHADKHAAYGDSWKKRGEMLGIMANIARKVDRLGVAGGGDSSADTAVDLLMYLLKYELWLEEQAVNASVGNRAGEISYTTGQEHLDRVAAALQRLAAQASLEVYPDEDLIRGIRGGFDQLEHYVEEKRAGRVYTVRQLVRLAYPLAVRLWQAEQQAAKAKEDHRAANAVRPWAGYEEAK